MRQIREVLRQQWGLGLSNRRISDSCGVSRPTVAEYLRRAKAAGLSWPLSSELDDAELERKLFPLPPSIPAKECAVPDWSVVHEESKRKGVTMALLWDYTPRIRHLLHQLAPKLDQMNTPIYRSSPYVRMASFA